MSQLIPTIKLTVYEGDTLLSTEIFQRDVINIGKLARSHLRIEDENVSRMHAVIEVTRDGKIEIADLDSTNGTFLNTEQIKRSTLRHGDEITIGETRILVAIRMPSTQRRSNDGRTRNLATGDRPAFTSPQKFLQTPPRSTGTGNFALEVTELWGNTISSVNQYQRHTGIAYATLGKLFEGLLQRIEDKLNTLPIAIYLLGSIFIASPVRALASLFGGANESKQETLSMGGTEKDDFLVTEGELVSESMNIIVPKDDVGYALNLGIPVEGSILHKGHHYTWSEAREKLGKDFLPLDRETRAVVISGQLRLLFSVEEVDAQYTRSMLAIFRERDRREDLAFLLFLLLCTIAQLGSIEYMKTLPPDVVGAKLKRQENSRRFLKAIQIAEMEKKELEEKEEEEDKDKDKKANKKEAKQVSVDRPTRVTRKVPKKEIDPKNKLTEEERKARAKEKADKLAETRMKSVNDLLAEDDPSEEMEAGMRSGTIIASTAEGATGSTLDPFSGSSGPLASADSGGPATVGYEGSGSARAAKGLGKGDIGRDSGIKGQKMKDKKVRVKFNKPTVSKNYDPEWVRRVIRKNRDQIKWCYQKELQRNPNLVGKLVLSFKIAPDGSLRSPSIVKNDLSTAAVGECLAQKSIRWIFQKPPDGGVVKVTYPFFFKSN